MIALTIAALAPLAHSAADPAHDCAAVLGDLGAPSGPKGLIPFCPPHAGYFSLQDPKALVPRVVVERVNGEAVVKGCVPRTNNFHADPVLPTASPRDYARSGYDLGHQDPAEDADMDPGKMLDTFNTANMAPQLGGFNRQIWKGQEEWTRAAALALGEIVVYTGPILGGAKTIGEDHVAVPVKFFKVQYDEKSGKAWAFIYDNEAGPVDDPVVKHQKPLGEVEEATGIKFPFKFDRKAVPALPPADLATWRAAHAKACHK